MAGEEAISELYSLLGLVEEKAATDKFIGAGAGTLAARAHWRGKERAYEWVALEIRKRLAVHKVRDLGSGA